MAHTGSLFLDEIGELPQSLQVKLLHVIQTKELTPVGDTRVITVDVRIIAATNADLMQRVKEGRFREDLFYRLNVIEITIPPLRDRPEDIPLLARHFMERLSHELGKDIADISEGGLRVLMDHYWPGNVRELENAMERAMVTCRTRTLTEEDFAFIAQNGAAKGWPVPAGMSIQDMEKMLIAATLQRTGGNIKESASLLGIDRSTLYEKIKRYDIPRPA
jgi:transcriptional regulator with PAS, ATPase and Fis domain